MTFTCNLCSEIFASLSLLDNHRKLTHQSTVSLASGQIVYRNEENHFTCPVHHTSGNHPQFVRRHASCYQQNTALVENDHNQNSMELENESLSEDSISLEMSDQDRLESQELDRYHLGFDESRSYMYCKDCKGILNRNFFNHVRRVHKVSITAVEIAAIQRNYSISNFSIDYTMTHDPFDYLKVIRGFQCNVCKWCCSDLRNFKSHASKNSHANGFASCCIQSASLGNAKKYFRVFETPAGWNQEDVSIEVKIFNSSSILQSGEVPQENFRTRRLLYTKRGWFVDQSEFDYIVQNGLLEFVECPSCLSHCENQLRGWLRECLESVRDWDVQYRRQLGTTGHPLLYLETNESRSAYAKEMLACVFFAVNAIQRPVLFYCNPSPSVATAVTNFMARPSKDNIIDLLYHLGFEPTSSTTRCTSCLMTYIRINCLCQDGSLLGEMGISQRAAKIVYMIKMAFYLWHERGRIDQFRSNLPALHGDTLSVPASLFMLLEEAKEAAFDERPPAIIFESIKGVEICIRGIRIQYNLFPTIFSASQTKLLELLDKLSLGAQLTVDPTLVLDDPSSSRMGKGLEYIARGYSETALVKHICRSNGLKQRFLLDRPGETISWQSRTILEYMAIYDRFVEELAFFIHFTSGMPARGTELETLQLRNSVSSRKSVFLKGSSIFIFCSYSKTNSMGRNKRICRFLDTFASNLVRVDYFFIRPFVNILAEAAGNNTENIYRYFWFVRDGRRMLADQLRDNFTSKLQAYSSKGLNFQDFRHLAEYISRILLKIPLPAESQDDENNAVSNLPEMMARQIGHTRKIGHKKYAVTASDHPEVDNHDLEMFEACSSLWQAFVRSGGFHSQATDTLEHDDISENLASRKKPSILRQVVEVEIPSPIYEVISPKKFQFPSGVNQSRSEDSLAILKRFFRNQLAEFASNEQHHAVNHVLHTNDNLLIVLPTGGGKSLLFLLESFSKSGQSTLVVVPTKSLVCDLERRALGHSLSVCTDLRLFNGQKMILCTIDSAVTETAIGFFQRLALDKRLSRIFIDEAHVYVTESKFRESMQGLPRFVSVGAPLALLSGTVSKEIENSLVGNFFRWSGGHVIRAKCNRPEIIYSVKLVGSDEDILDDIFLREDSLLAHERIIIYFNSISDLEEMGEKLELKGLFSRRYYADMSTENKHNSFQDWSAGNVNIMLSSSAFGVGIDFPSVRHVLVKGLPFSFEDLVQMFGRAGRDRQVSHACMYLGTRESLMTFGYLDKKEAEMRKLVHAFALSKSCRRQLISSMFDSFPTACFLDIFNAKCDNCTVSDEVTDHEDFFEPVHAAIDFLAQNSSQDLFNETKIANHNIKMLLDKVKSLCPVCLVLTNRQLKHALFRCPNMANLCGTCQGMETSKMHSMASSCPLKTQKPKGRNTCFKCFFPNEIGGAVYHPIRDETNSGCPGDFVLPYAVARFKYDRGTLSFKGTSLSEYFHWLEEQSGRFQNICNVFLELQNIIN